MKRLLVLLTVAMFSISGVLASGYGGYDEEPIEVETIEISLRGLLKATCEESNKTIMDMININNCYDKWTIEENCECLEDGGFQVSEMTKTIGCEAEAYLY